MTNVWIVMGISTTDTGRGDWDSVESIRFVSMTEDEALREVHRLNLWVDEYHSAVSRWTKAANDIWEQEKAGMPPTQDPGYMELAKLVYARSLKRIQEELGKQPEKPKDMEDEFKIVTVPVGVSGRHEI